jgi:hypothetical protein
MTSETEEGTLRRLARYSDEYFRGHLAILKSRKRWCIQLGATKRFVKGRGVEFTEAATAAIAAAEEAVADEKEIEAMMNEGEDIDEE